MTEDKIGLPKTKLDDVGLLTLPKFEDVRGNLSFLEEDLQIPFEIKRTYFIYDVPGGQVRGGHAFRQQEEIIIALSGSFEVVVKDQAESQSHYLNRSYYGLYVPAGLWRQMRNFSTNSMALVISSTEYQEGDYIRSFDEFLKLKGNA